MLLNEPASEEEENEREREEEKTSEFLAETKKKVGRTLFHVRYLTPAAVSSLFLFLSFHPPTH